MGIEIERKFLLRDDDWRAMASHARQMVQGYLVDADLVAARQGVTCSIRVRSAEQEAWLNIKSAELGVARIEYDYPIPIEDAREMLRDFCAGVVAKTRHYVPIDEFLFEVDEFHGDNAGLVVAELELDAVDREFSRPAWLGKEVSGVLRYYNLNLLAHPYSRWTVGEQNGD